MLNSSPRRIGQLRRPATRVPTVCVVDPKTDDYQDWNATAEASGVRLQIVASAEEALRFAAAHAVDLWVVNTKLPGLSGCELCEMLKSRSAQVPVYLVADEYTLEAERKALRHRGTLFGCKGGHIDWLGNWLQMNSARPETRSCKEKLSY